jgi:hypothetical protein
VLKLAGIKYVVMTNIPFDPEEVKKWKQAKPIQIPPQFKVGEGRAVITPAS